MKQKFFSWLVLSLLVTGLPVSGWAQKRKRNPKPKTAKATKVATPKEAPVVAADEKEAPPVELPPLKVTPASAETLSARASLLASLPQGDAVGFVDLKRALTDALPAVLAHDPQRLAKINAQLDKFQKDTGLDPRSFERVALSFRITPANGGFNAKPFALVNGTFNAGALIAAGRFAAEGKYKQEEYKGKQIYLFEVGSFGKDIPGLGALLGGEALALTDLGVNTLAVGEVATVKEIIDANGEPSRANAELIAAATRNPNALLGLSTNVPAGTVKSFGMETEEDELAKTLNTIRQVSVSLGLAERGAEMALSARTEKEADAKNLTDTLNALKQFAGFAIGNLKPNQQKMALNALETLSVVQSGSETQVSLAVNRNDFPALLGLIK